MDRAPALRLLFATDFSTACVDALWSVAPLAEAGRLEVTVVHVVSPGRSVARARQELASFLMEADDSGGWRQILCEASDAPAMVAALADRTGSDLILAPAADPFSLASAVRPSFRGRLLTVAPVPLWTAGPATDLTRSPGRLRNVACLVAWDHAARDRVRLAAAFARRMGARLHLLDLVPPITEGVLVDVLDSDRPLSVETSTARMRELLGGCADAGVLAVAGGGGGDLRRALAACQADVVFVDGDQARRGVVRRRFARRLDRLHCPVVCLSASLAAATRWSFERPAVGGEQPTPRARPLSVVVG